MSYRTYRPKGSNVKAIKVTKETAQFVASWCHGILERIPDALSNYEDDAITVRVPSLEGVKIVTEGEYLVLTTNNGFVVMNEAEFEDRYEPVKSARGSKTEE